MAIKPVSGLAKAAWRAKLSAEHRGPKPGKVRVQKPPKLPSQKVRW